MSDALEDIIVEDIVDDAERAQVIRKYIVEAGVEGAEDVQKLQQWEACGRYCVQKLCMLVTGSWGHRAKLYHVILACKISRAGQRHSNRLWWKIH